MVGSGVTLSIRGCTSSTSTFLPLYLNIRACARVLKLPAGCEIDHLCQRNLFVRDASINIGKAYHWSHTLCARSTIYINPVDY